MPPQGTRKAGFARVARLWLQVLFYSVLCGTAAFLMGLEPFSVTSLVRMLLPVTFSEYWYFTDYVILILASPCAARLPGASGAPGKPS